MHVVAGRVTRGSCHWRRRLGGGGADGDGDGQEGGKGECAGGKARPGRKRLASLGRRCRRAAPTPEAVKGTPSPAHTRRPHLLAHGPFLHPLPHRLTTARDGSSLLRRHFITMALGPPT